MTLSELQRTLRAADPRAVLVPSRILEKIIAEAHDLRTPTGAPTGGVPHRACHIVDRQALFRHAEQSDLNLEPDQILPDTVILLARPAAEELSDLERSLVLLTFWRRLFHAQVHLAFGEDPATGPKLNDADVRARIDRLGAAEFEEVRTVLTQDEHLPRGANDRSVYTEFAAVFLETRCFAIDLLPNLFPGLRDRPAVEAMLAEDVDADAIFARTRLAGAPEPAAARDAAAEETESHEQYWILVRAGERASISGNAVRAAILRNRAWRIAPAALSQGTREQALADVRRLGERLAAALELPPEASSDWARVLPQLLDKADQAGRPPAEARLLLDLQQVCLDHERDMYALDLVEWGLSAGKRPVKRPLPGLRLVRTTRHLRNASRRVPAVRLNDADRARLTRLVETSLEDSEQALRDRFGRALATALHDAGLRPSLAAERVAFDKMVAEWLDRIITHGFLTFADLRDTISRNQLKLPDLADPEDFIRGDPLLRLDRRLAALLDGVYRPSEVYMRWLERLTALNFGTRGGRLLTLWCTVPLGGAFLALQVLGVLLHLIADVSGGVTGWLHKVLVGPWLAGGGEGAPAGPHWIWHALLMTTTAVFITALVHSRQFRRTTRKKIADTGHATRVVFVELPRRAVKWAALQQFMRGWPFQLTWWYVIKPLAVSAIIWLLVPAARRNLESAALVFLAVALVINSRVGQSLTKAARQGLSALATAIRAGLLPNLYRLIVEAFKQVVDFIEWIIFTVDEWLRFRTGDTQASLVVRTIAGVIWFPIAYVARFYMVVLVEPGFNPVKAPVSYVAAKVMLPISVPLTGLLVGWTTPIMPDWIAYTIVIPTVWLLPDVFGFLFWETKENWRLYRANRRPTVREVVVGPHGQTVRGLLEPGFHSGTVPRLYRRLRTAERTAHRTRNWAAARSYQHQLNDVSGAVERFVDRELVAVLKQTRSFGEQSPAVGRIALAVNRVEIELVHAGEPGTIVTPGEFSDVAATVMGSRAARVEIELREGWLIADVADPGWLATTTPARRRAAAAALASLYKLAGVDAVREQIDGALPGPSARWDVTRAGVVVQASPDTEPVVYSLSDTADPDPDAARFLFRLTPLYWDRWVQAWEQDRQGEMPDEAEFWDRLLMPESIRAVAVPLPSAVDEIAQARSASA